MTRPRWRRLLPAVLSLLVTGAPARAQLALIRQGPESSGQAEAGDWHGWAVALGDFDRDGYADLATGAPLEHTGSEVFSSGVVVINRGTPHGLSWEGAYALSVLDGSLDPAQNHQMGRALAVGDFDGNSYADLAVGLPASTVNGQAAAGRVLIYYGGPGGLPGTATVIHQGLVGAAVESGDLFGEALAAGRLGSDEYDDLIIGAPGENEDRGAVFVMRGSLLGLGNTQILLGADLGHPNQPGDEFGSAMAIGNIVGFPAGELIVGAPKAELTLSAPSSGLVYIANASDSSVATGNALLVTALDFSDPLFADGNFGAALCVGNFWGDSVTRGLAIGATGNHGGGRVYVGRGTPLGIAWTVILQQNESGMVNGIPLADEPGDAFGAALAAGDQDNDGYDDLAVGAPGEDFELALAGDDTGAVHIFTGSSDGPSQGEAATSWTIDLGDQVFERAWLGRSLAAGRTSASPRQSFVAGAPRRDDDRGQVFDIAPWRQVPRLLCRSAVAADCENNIVYALRPFERVKVASTTKIMTVLLACEATARPASDPLRVGLQEEYTIEPWMYEAFPFTSSCSLFEFTPLPSLISESYSFEELFYACIMPSGNDAAYAIADAMTGEITAWPNPAQQFVDLMNERAEAIGMTETFFTNPAGTDGGNPYSTAFDMWLLARAAMANSLFRQVVNTTSYIMEKILLGAEEGMFDTVLVKVNYGWLTALKNRDSRIVGLKPGGTPGAKTTGVVAARFDAAGNKLAYATGFRWLDGDYAKDKLAALVQLGLAFCNTDIETPSGLSLPSGPSRSEPLARQTWFYGGNQPPVAVQFGSFDSGEPDPQDPARPSQSLAVIDLSAFYRGGSPATAKAFWKYRALWELPPGGRAGLRIDPIVGGTVRLRVVNEEGVVRPPDATLRLSGTLHSRGEELVTVRAEEDYLPRAWNGFSLPSGPVELRIGNGGSETILLALDGRFELRMDFAGAMEDLFQARLEPLLASVRSGHVICQGETSGGRDFAVELVLEDRRGGARFVPPIIITNFRHRRLASRQAEALSLNFGAAGWDWPIEPFIEEFVVEEVHSLGPGIWRSLGRVPAGRERVYEWSGEVPAQPSRFLRLRSVPPAVE